MDARNSYRVLKGQTLATMIILPFVPFILCLLIGYYHFTVSLRDNTEAKMVRVVEDHRRLIEMFLEERRADLDFIINTYQFNQLNRPSDLTLILEALQKKSKAFLDLGVFDQAGNHVAYIGPYQLAGKNYFQAEWFQELLKRRYYISNIFLGYRRVPHFIIAVARREGAESWVIRATIDTQFFTGLVEKVRIGKTGEAYIVDQSGIFQTRRRSGGELMSRDQEATQYLSPHQGIRTFMMNDQDSEDYLCATAWLKDNNWLLVVRQEEADVFLALHQATLTVLLISVIGGLLIVITAYYMTNNLISRMERADLKADSLNRQLIVAGRLAEIGEMSAGFAHEINNPLQIIRVEQSLCRTLLEELIQEGDIKDSTQLAELEDSIDQIATQVDRCAGITHSVLKFARQGEAEVQDVQLSQFIPEVVKLVAQKAGVEGIELQQNVAEDTPTIKADPAQLQQVLINLLNNSVYAVIKRHGHQGGRIDVAVNPASEGVEINVTDNGCGIGEMDCQKLFTPFFTTKPVGQGTGLGLSVCFGIIEKMGGRISVESAEGVGTIFELSLPFRPGLRAKSNPKVRQAGSGPVQNNLEA